MRRLLCLTMLFLTIGVTYAEDVNAIVLWLKDNSQIVFKLEEKPIVKFEGNDLVITTGKNTVSYRSNDIRKFTYSNLNANSVGIIPETKSIFSILDNILTVNNIEPFSKVEIYSVDGLLLCEKETDVNGFVSILLPYSPGNTIVIKTTYSTFKVRKP